MGRLIFVTVGTSAIGNPELWKDKRALKACLPSDGRWDAMVRHDEALCIEEHRNRGKQVKWEEVEKQVRNLRSSFEEQVTELHRKFWEDSNGHHRRTNSRRTSAETISTWLAGESGEIGGPLIPDKDRVVLLASRTCVGQMAARINERIFREYLLRGGAEESVVIETISDLRLSGIVDEKDGEEPLFNQVRKIYERHAGNSLHKPLFNITGGFKGVIPVIAVLCTDEAISMMYLHDSMRSVVVFQFENGKLIQEYEPTHCED